MAERRVTPASPFDPTAPLSQLDIALSESGRATEALESFDEAEDLFDAIGNRAGAAKSLRKKSFVFWRRGRRA